MPVRLAPLEKSVIQPLKTELQASSKWRGFFVFTNLLIYKLFLPLLSKEQKLKRILWHEKQEVLKNK